MEELINKLNVTIGKTKDGKDFTVDLEKMPHALITGSTGSGKTILIRNIIASLIKNNTKDEVKLVLVDLKRVEFSRFSDLPHLYCDVIGDEEKLNETLNELIVEMNNRYQLLMDNNARTINDYNKISDEKLPYIFLIMDETHILEDDVCDLFTKLASLGRGAGIHLILSAQSLQVSNITGKLKVNLPTKFVFKVSSMFDSLSILDRSGAENLKGSGDMIYSYGDILENIQVNYINNDELKAIIENTKKLDESNNK